MNKKIIFFDTETTGNTKNDFLCQIAYKVGEDNFSGLYKPPIKIPPEVSAIHHITNKMVEDKKSFSKSPEHNTIKELFEKENSVVVAHNAQFDLMIIKKENIIPKNFICTLRLTRYLDPEGKFKKYNLQYLRYFLELEVEATAHDALGDVLVLEQLYERLKKKIMEKENLNDEEVINKMIEVSSHPSLLTIMNFGKYAGKKIEEILQINRGYLEWLLKQKLEGDQIDEDWVYTLKYYLRE